MKKILGIVFYKMYYFWSIIIFQVQFKSFIKLKPKKKKMNFSFDFLNIHIIQLAQLGKNTIKGAKEVVNNV